MSLERIHSLVALLGMFDESVHKSIVDLSESDPADEGLVVFENLDMSSSALGERSVLTVGPNRTIKTIEACEGQHLGDLPSQRKYATKFWRKGGPEVKAHLGRKGKALPLDQPLTAASSSAAIRFLNRIGWPSLKEGQTYREDVQGLGVNYELAVRPTGSGYRAWSTVWGNCFPNDPCHCITFERYASAPSYDMLKRKLERCILDAWAEIERRSHVALLNAASQYAQGTPWFAEAVELQEALWGQSDYQSMSIEQARKWRAWVDLFIDNKLALPPSRQLPEATSPFMLAHGGLVIYEGATAFWIFPEGQPDDEVCMGDMVSAYSDSGLNHEAYEALSHDFITNSGDFWAAYFDK